MESPNPREFACYQRTKVRYSQCEDTRIVTRAASGSGCGQWTSRSDIVIHHRTDELLIGQHNVSDGQAASTIKEGPSTPNI
jgi:hypothetical protein